MDNYAIADQLSLLAKLMDIHGENSFKSKSYSSAAFAIEKLPKEIASMPHEKIFTIKGIGESVGKKIIEILETGQPNQLREYLSNTPEGVLEMMNIKGLGPKKINLLWKELGISTIENLQIACEKSIIAQKKGFGEKTQQNILDSILFQKENSGKYLYAKIEPFAHAILARIKEKFNDYQIEVTGDFKRQLEIIESLDWVTTIPAKKLKEYLITDDVQLVTDKENMLLLNAENMVVLRFFITAPNDFYKRLFETSSSEAFMDAWNKNETSYENLSTEEDIFKRSNIQFIPSFLRENSEIIERARKHSIPKVIETSDIKGLIHSHSNWSDGSYTIEEMATELIKAGFEYLVISDHSKSAFYANGLSEERIREQHRYIDELNKKLAPFKIFKSIECDILNEGTLDYPDKILSLFDLVITSVHSNLDMDEEKAMKRLLGAISNPYTTIMGHMTGRLLLRRKGYPVDYKTIIEACAHHQVAIEINASPSRLDMDWRWINYALEKGVMLSIDPDAHTTEEFTNIKYGVFVAQKGGLPANRNLSSMSLAEFKLYLENRKKVKNLS